MFVVELSVFHPLYLFVFPGSMSESSTDSIS